MVDEWRVDFSQLAIARVGAVGVVRVPAMLGMDAQRHPCQPGQRRNLQGCQVAGMNNIWLELAQQFVDSRIQGNGVTRRLVQCNELNTRLGDAVFEVANRSQRQDDVLKLIRRKAVDELDDDVLKTTDGEAVDNMDNAPSPHGVACHQPATKAGSTGLDSMLPLARRRNASNINRVQSGAE